MTDWIDLIMVFVAGIGLGTMFFVGLWLTVQKALKSSMPAVWVLGSFVFRIVLVMSAFYYIGLGSWQKIVACVAGFFLARIVVTYYTRPKNKVIFDNREEVSHEA
jgi:F1F0 ATPase subunit 2